MQLFFNLIQCGIGQRAALPATPSKEQWQQIFDISLKHTLLGIAFAGIEKLPKEQLPPKEILLQFHQAAETIKKANCDTNKRCALISQKFKQEGFPNCILKGQGIAQLYPTPLLRTPGDIDIWLGGSDKSIINYVRQHAPHSTPTYHHIDFPAQGKAKGKVHIELHFRPSWLYNPFTNRKLQKLFASASKEQFSNIIETPQGSFPAPTTTFNRIYILLHIYRHLFQEGIGLRQLLDYYFVLAQGFTPEERDATMRTLKSLGLKRFTAAMMHVLHATFNLPPSQMLTAPHKSSGEFLLNEIMAAGNFGKHDTRYAIVSPTNELRHFINSMQRISRLTAQYPLETLWSPCFKIWHHLWRKRHSK